jgi:hypothetical protein
LEELYQLDIHHLDLVEFDFVVDLQLVVDLVVVVEVVTLN